MSWGGNTFNLDGNTGWAWGSGAQADPGGWDAVSEEPAVGWSLAQWGGAALPSSSELPPLPAQPPPPLPNPTSEQKASSAGVSTARTSSSSALRYEQNVPPPKEDYEIYRAPSATPTELSSVGVGSSYLKSSDPMQSFKVTVRLLLLAVRRQIDYDQASAQLDQWRKTRESEAYAHATPATRRRLDEVRVEIGNKQSEAQKKLKIALDMLAEQCSQSDSALDIADDSEMTRFTNEMKEWLQNASQHPTVQKQLGPQSAEDLAQEAAQESVFSKEPSQWTVDDIRNALSELDNDIDTLSEVVYSDNESLSPPKEPDNEMSRWRTRLIEGQRQYLEALIIQAEEEQQRVEETFATSAEQVATLMRDNASLRNELGASLAALDTLDTTVAKLTSLVEEAERVDTQDEGYLAEVTALVQNMLVTDHPPPEPKMDLLLPPLQHKIIPHLIAELVPLIEQFRSMCSQHEEKTQAFADKVSDYLVTKMDIIMKGAQTQ